MTKNNLTITFSCFFAMLILVLNGNVLFAQQIVSLDTITEQLSATDKETLLNATMLTYTSYPQTKNRVIYQPKLNLFTVLNDYIKDTKPTILYEILYLFKETDPVKQEKLMVGISNYLRDVEVLATIKYQNLKDGNIHPLFNSSYPIVSSSDNTKIAPQPKLVNFPNQDTKQTVKVKQDMPPFGDVISRYQYQYNDYYSSFLGNNETDISYNNIRAVKVNHMLTTSWIIKTDKGILFYGVGAVRVTGLAVLFGNVISNSFSSRMVGLFNWLIAKSAEL